MTITIRIPAGPDERWDSAVGPGLVGRVLDFNGSPAVVEEARVVDDGRAVLVTIAPSGPITLTIP